MDTTAEVTLPSSPDQHQPQSDFIQSHFIDQDKKYIKIYKKEIDSLKKERKEVLDSKVLHMHGKTMKFNIFHIGNKSSGPKGGWALIIGMHGGGGCESHANDG